MSEDYPRSLFWEDCVSVTDHFSWVIESAEGDGVPETAARYRSERQAFERILARARVNEYVGDLGSLAIIVEAHFEQAIAECERDGIPMEAEDYRDDLRRFHRILDKARNSPGTV